MRSVAVDLAWVTTAIAVIVLFTFELWDIDLRVPLSYEGDGYWHGRDVQTIIETGWVQSSQRLGFPLRATMLDYPIAGDNLHFLAIRAMATVIGDWALLVNLFYLASFFTIGWSSYLCQRWLGCGRRTAIVASVLFTLAPYHFGRGTYHLYLSSYWIVPVTVLIAARAASGLGMAAATRAPSTGARLAAAAPWVLLCAAAASSGSYYAIFAVVSIAMMSLLAAASHRTLRPIVAGAGYCAAICVVLIANYSTSIVHRIREGPNGITTRFPIEGDTYALRLIQLVTPTPGNVFAPLRVITDELVLARNAETVQFLGAFSAIALIAMLVWLVGLLVRQQAHIGGDATRRFLATLALLWIVAATSGGIHWLFSLVEFRSIRAWNRISILVQFCVLTWLALTAAPRLVLLARSRRRWARPATVSVAATLAVLAVVEQTTHDLVPDASPHAAEYRRDREWFTSLEARLPTGTAIFQLPVRFFPDAGSTVDADENSAFRPYLLTSDLRFSYGGMRGREADWMYEMIDIPGAQLIRKAIATGFDGVLVDRAGYADRGQALEAELGAVTGRELLVSADERWSYLAIDGLEGIAGSLEEQAIDRALLLHEELPGRRGCSFTEGIGPNYFEWCGTSGELFLDGGETPALARLVANVGTLGEVGTLRITGPGVDLVVPLGLEQQRIDVALPASGEPLRFTADVAPTDPIDPGDQRDLRFVLINAEVARVGMADP